MEFRIMPVTKLKPRLLKVIAHAQKLGQEFVVTKNGQPAAVIIGFDEWESWRETMAVLSDPRAMARIRRSRRYFARSGKGKTIEEIFGAGE